MVPTIRKAKINDLDFIDQLYVTNALDEVKQQFPKRTKDLILTDFKKHEKSRKKSFLINLKKKNFIFLVVESDNELVGFGEGIIEKSFDGKIGLLDKIYINKKNRGQGIGFKIALELIKKMKKRGIKIFDWRCYSSNKFSIKLAEKLGFYSFAIGFRKKV
ncbi:MAG: hypothetical protein QT05_C0005G0021 [archaeon GW2011_AR13]|nr:MAG: hypothetical protein QT05_C0005G0021 [archaeon GW2011_AR13]HIG94472.1 GNAT family N-acetyltransferase [Nanoarchaeota archaeon]HIH62982.1 GNAT family N-acetyltransferase [Nanoarchaeota archaeon]HIJ10247.1 GNAT family N-acetyltransferase [Nanoarchaeota archaeon]